VRCNFPYSYYMLNIPPMLGHLTPADYYKVMSFEEDRLDSKIEQSDPSWQEPFDWQEPKEWQEAGSLNELARVVSEDPRIHAALMLLQNRERAMQLYPWHDGLHTPPAAEHYRHTYLWDSGFVQMMLAVAAWLCGKGADQLEDKLAAIDQAGNSHIQSTVETLRQYYSYFQRASVEEGFSVVRGQKPDGFIPNLQYGEGTLWYEVEKHLSIDRVNKSSNYTQPPVLPLATYATYKSMRESGDINAELYLSEMYGYQDKFMRYFNTYPRINSAIDRKIGVIEPHETGLDSLEQWDYIKPYRAARNGADTLADIDERNRFADGAHFVLRLVKRRLIARGNLAKERELFWCNDMMMNGIYIHNLRVMSRLAAELGKDDEQFYMELARQVEAQVIADMWQEDPDKVPIPGFYSLDADGEPIPTITISNLFALTLPNLPEAKLEAVLDMMDEHFDVPYPLPSGSIKSPNYDPDNQEKDRLWRGPTWINTNWYITEHGLAMQSVRSEIRTELRTRCRQWANRIAISSNELIDLNEPTEPIARSLGAKAVDLVTNREMESQELVTGAWEHYHPQTGEGQRPRVRNFAWSWLARFMTIHEDNSDIKAA
jgi:hypothetical protein